MKVSKVGQIRLSNAVGGFMYLQAEHARFVKREGKASDARVSQWTLLGLPANSCQPQPNQLTNGRAKSPARIGATEKPEPTNSKVSGGRRELVSRGNGAAPLIVLTCPLEDGVIGRADFVEEAQSVGSFRLQCEVD